LKQIFVRNKYFFEFFIPQKGISSAGKKKQFSKKKIIFEGKIWGKKSILEFLPKKKYFWSIWCA